MLVLGFRLALPLEGNPVPLDKLNDKIALLRFYLALVAFARIELRCQNKSEV